MQQDPFPNSTLYHGNNSTIERYRVRGLLDLLNGTSFLIVNRMGNGGDLRESYLKISECEDDRIVLQDHSKGRRVKAVYDQHIRAKQKANGRVNRS